MMHHLGSRVGAWDRTENLHWNTLGRPPAYNNVARAAHDIGFSQFKTCYWSGRMRVR